MSYTLLRRTDKTSRKEHQCIWCPEKIMSGERYCEEASIYCGDFQFMKWHPECLEAAKEYFSEPYNDEFDPHEFKRGTVLMA